MVEKIIVLPLGALSIISTERIVISIKMIISLRLVKFILNTNRTIYSSFSL